MTLPASASPVRKNFSTKQPWHVPAAFLAIAVIALVTRLFQLAHRDFYWDDLVIPAKYRDASFTGLFEPYDGHVMPGSIALQLAADRLASLEFWLPATVITVFTAALLALWAFTLPRLFAARSSSSTSSRSTASVQVFAFAALALSPFLMTAAGWWSAALNSFGWQLGFAVALMCATLLFHAEPRTKTTQRTIALSAITTVAVLCALLLTEKSLSVVPFAALIIWFTSGRVLWRFWVAPAAVTAAWAILVFKQTSIFHSEAPHSLWSSLPETLSKAVIPGIVGGPWQWERWTPSQAFANPSPWLWVPTLVIVLVTAVVWVVRSPRRGSALVASALFLVALLWVLGHARTNPESADLLTHTLHYYAEWWTLTVFVVTAASFRWPSSRRPLPRLRPILTAVWVVSAVITSVSWTVTWKDAPTGPYLDNLKKSLASSSAPVLNQPVPMEILFPLLRPLNTIYSVTGQAHSDITDKPQVIDSQGNLVPGAVLPAAKTEQGPEPQCGIRVFSGGSRIITIDKPLFDGLWAWELNAVASEKNMTMTITTPNGLETEEETRSRAVTVPISTDLAPRWVSVPGGGGTIRVEIEGPDSAAHVCIGAGTIGPMVPQQ